MSGKEYTPPKKGLGRIFLRVLSAAFSRPWEYMGEGAPNEWEFRVSPDEETLAVWDPNRDKWKLIDGRRLVVIAEVKMAEMDRNTDNWARFVEELDD